MEQSNKDLLLCENKYYLEKSKLENKIDLRKIDQEKNKPKELRTQKITSNVISQVKAFLDKAQAEDKGKCANIEVNDDDDDDNDNKDKQKIQLDLLLFKRADDSDDEYHDDSDDDDDESSLSLDSDLCDH